MEFHPPLLKIELEGGSYYDSRRKQGSPTPSIQKETLNKGNLATVDEIIASDYICHGLAPEVPFGLDSLKQVFTMVHTAFHDLNIDVNPSVGEWDMVVTQLTHRGTDGLS